MASRVDEIECRSVEHSGSLGALDVDDHRGVGAVRARRGAREAEIIDGVVQSPISTMRSVDGRSSVMPPLTVPNRRPASRPITGSAPLKPAAVTGTRTACTRVSGVRAEMTWWRPCSTRRRSSLRRCLDRPPNASNWSTTAGSSACGELHDLHPAAGHEQLDGDGVVRGGDEWCALAGAQHDVQGEWIGPGSP